MWREKAARMSKSYYRVFFSSNSQQGAEGDGFAAECQRATIVFSFQAIHNAHIDINSVRGNVKELLSCFLFKQFTTVLLCVCLFVKCQRATIVFSFQAIHNHAGLEPTSDAMSKSYYRVFFSSNSQLSIGRYWKTTKCQRATIVFSFQAIHNSPFHDHFRGDNVKELLSCFLFKQFTTCWNCILCW